MIKSLIFFSFIFLLFNPKTSFSKDKLRKYAIGYYVTNKGDTINGYIKKLKATSSCNRIKFKKDNDSRPIEFYPEDIISYKRGGNIFISKNISDDEFSSKYFLYLTVKGELSQYKRWKKRYYKGVNGETKKQVDEINYLELRGKPIFRVRKINFRESVSLYLSDNKCLADKIMKKELRSIRLIVNEYNHWHKNRKELKKLTE